MSTCPLVSLVCRIWLVWSICARPRTLPSQGMMESLNNDDPWRKLSSIAKMSQTERRTRLKSMQKHRQAKVKPPEPSLIFTSITIFTVRTLSRRDAYPFQNGWIFGKVPNGLWPPPLIFGKLCCKFFPKFMTEVSSIMAKICNINFWIENAPPPLWNFSENSSVLEGVSVP